MYVIFPTLNFIVLPLPLISFLQLFPVISGAYTLQSIPPTTYLWTIFVIVVEYDEGWVVEDRWVHQNGMYEPDEGVVRIVWEVRFAVVIC